MDIPTSEVGYTSATTGRGDHQVQTDIWWHWVKKFKKNKNSIYPHACMHRRGKRLTVRGSTGCLYFVFVCEGSFTDAACNEIKQN
jgi:hypothetical protein